MTIHDDLSEFVSRITQAAGDNLESVLLYGSAAREQHDDTFSDVNVLCVLRQTGGPALDAVAPVASWWSNSLGHRPPMVVGLEELRSSADVFSIETLDLKQANRVLYGSDVMASIEVPTNLHRVQLEHELRTLVLRLRQHYLLAQADEKNLRLVLAKSVSTALTLLRHALLAADVPAEGDKRDIIAAAQKAFGIDTTSVGAALDLREQRRVEMATNTLYRAYMDCLAGVVEKIDRVAPKSQWQRSAGFQDAE